MVPLEPNQSARTWYLINTLKKRVALMGTEWAKSEPQSYSAALSFTSPSPGLEHH